MNEAETRAEHIDPALAAAGWGVVEGSRILREHPITPGRIEGLGRRGKPLIADYVLVYRNHKLAVVEARASTASTCRPARKAIFHRNTVFGAERAANLAPTGWALERGMLLTSHHDAPVAKPDSMRVLDQNSLTVDPLKIAGIKVLETIKEGRSVYLPPDKANEVAQTTGCSASEACFGLATETLAQAG